MSASHHPIIFCGAGPGDPDLITVKGRRALERADLILFAGSLVPEALLTWAPAGAQCISSADKDLDQIVGCMTEAHAAGQRVVRLHTGDPSLYGAIREQMARLDRAGIPYEVIPGVTAAFAAAAALGIEYTLPEQTQTLILTRMSGRTPVPDAESLETLARPGASMAIYLSMGMVDRVAGILAKTYGPQAACVIAYRVSQPQEKIITSRVSDLVETARSAGIDRHALIIVGPAVGPAEEQSAPQSKLYDRNFAHGYRPR